MKIIEHLQALDDLIVCHTTPPTTAKLRNKLATIIEQAEVEGDLPDAMAQLQTEKAKVDAELSKMKAKERERIISDAWWREKAEKHQRLIQGTRLRYDT